jgi:hypothetical protein
MDDCETQENSGAAFFYNVPKLADGGRDPHGCSQQFGARSIDPISVQSDTQVQ